MIRIRSFVRPLAPARVACLALFCLSIVLLAPLAAEAAGETQISSDVTESGCTSSAPVTNAAASVAVWQSDCDLSAGNGDGSVEIFRAPVGGAAVQLTAGTNCSSMRPSMSGDGTRVAFESNCNLTGANSDGNVEIYVWDNGSIVQRTTSVACDNFAPSMSEDGRFVAYDSTCNLSGTNNDGRGAEIFRVNAKGAVSLRQLTVDPNGGACDSTSPSINGDGSLVAFDSDCNLVGTNPDSAIEIFTVTANSSVVQRTFAGEDDSCTSVRPAIDAEGEIMAFHSNCNFLGTNGDQSDEIFTVGTSDELRQVTDSNGTCASGEVRMASLGNAIVFSSYCRLNGFNSDGNVEVFQAGVGFGQSGILAVTGTNGSCSSIGGGASADGSLVTFDSSCNLVSGNQDGSVEIFRAGACVCGAPATRKSPPKASDALLALNAAVGARGCAKCECDTNADGNVSASDSQRVLRAAVGQQGVELVCPAP